MPQLAQAVDRFGPQFGSVVIKEQIGRQQNWRGPIADAPALGEESVETAEISLAGGGRIIRAIAGPRRSRLHLEKRTSGNGRLGLRQLVEHRAGLAGGRGHGLGRLGECLGE